MSSKTFLHLHKGWAKTADISKSQMARLVLIVEKYYASIRTAINFFGNIKTKVYTGSNCMHNIFLLLTQAAQFKF